MRYRAGNLVVLAMAPLWVFCATSASAQATTLTLFSDAANNSEVVLGNVTYSSSGQCASGQGQLSVLQLFGSNLTDVAGAGTPVPFQNLCFNVSGQVTGGSITLPSDVSTPSMFNGVGLILSRGTQLTVMAAGGLQLSGGLTLTLPLRDGQGHPAEVDLPGNSMSLTPGGAFTLHATGLHLKNSLVDGKAQLGGFAFTLSTFDLDIVRANGQTQKFLLVAHQPQVDAPLPVPGLLTDGHGVHLSATSVAVNKSGELQIKGGTAQNVQLALASPMAFTLQAKQVKFDKGFNSSDPEVKTDCILTDTSLQLPFTDADTKSLVTLQRSGDWDVTTTPVLELQADRNINVQWNAFDVRIPKNTSVVLDLSTNASDPLEQPDAQANSRGLPASWQGVYARDVQFLLPAYFTSSAGSGACSAGGTGASGSPVSVDAHNLAIGNSGLSVDVNLTAAQQICIAGFQAKLTSAAVTVTKSHIDPQSLKIGVSLTIPALGADTDWAMQLTDSGTFVLSLLTPNLDIPKFSGADVAGLDLAVSNATFELPATGPGLIRIDGQMMLKAAGSVSELAQGLVCHQSSSTSQTASQTDNCPVLDFKGLEIDTNGHFIAPDTGQFTLAHPVDVDLDVLKVEITNFSFGNDTDNSPYILFDGGVNVGGGLPAQAEVDFQGVKLASNGIVSLQGLEVKADVADILRIDASLNHSPNGCHKDATHTISCVKGAMKLGLNIGSLSTGSLDQSGDGFSFEAAKGSWLFTGGLTIPGNGIELGTSGLALFSAKGGVGYKVKPAPQQPDPYSQMGDPKYVVYLDPTLPGDDLLFSLGAGFGSFADAGFVFYGDADITLTTDPFTLDLNTRVKLQEQRSVAYENADRSGYADINFAAPDTLHASAGVDLYYPTRSSHIVEAHGTMDFVLSPTEQHFFLGWPPDTNPITVNVGVSNVEQFKFQGGLGVHMFGNSLPVDADPNCTGGDCTGVWFAAAVKWHGDMGPLSADIGGTADIALNQNSGSIDRFVGEVYADGKADFGPFSASATGYLAIAYLAPNQSVELYPPGEDPQQVSAPSDHGEIYVDGEVEGCGSVFGASVCKSIGVSHAFD
ncbi:MAG TPA: hypothetical protein VFW30_06645 [Bryocella sp.]|nr:hypothetical protein [Bryocella sp.]